MKRTFKTTLTAAVLSVSLAVTAVPTLVLAADAAVSEAQSVRGQYQLTPVIRVDIKSVTDERTGDSTRIGAAVRLYNEGTRVTRVPDFELRARTVDGIEYTLKPSAANAKAIQPKEKVDLSYMLTIDGGVAGELAEIAWVEVDEYVYPKVETTVLAVSVQGLAWNGEDFEADQGALSAWGKPFRLPVLSETLQFAPVTLINEKTPQGPVTVVTLVAENTGDRTETVPNFRIDGRTDSKSYPGKRVEESVELKPGEKKYIHYGILTENNVALTKLIVLTPETFVTLGADGSPSVEQFAVGRLSIELPQGDTVDPATLPAYTLRDRITFDPLSKLIDKETDVSLVDLSMNESEAAGYNTVIAKFLIKNNGERPVPLPAFQAELTNAQGFRYFGTRQVTAVEQLAPNLSYVINYAFAVPSSETGENLFMKLLDSQTAAPYNIPIAGFKTAVVEDKTDDDVLSFYPFTAKLRTWDISALGSAAGYTYKMRLDLDITAADDVVADPNASSMLIEICDPLGRPIASMTRPFTGQNHLVSGPQTFAIQNLLTDQFEWPLTINIYEAIQTPNGVAKRLVKTLKQ